MVHDADAPMRLAVSARACCASRSCPSSRAFLAAASAAAAPSPLAAAYALVFTMKGVRCLMLFALFFSSSVEQVYNSKAHKSPMTMMPWRFIQFALFIMNPSLINLIYIS